MNGIHDLGGMHGMGPIDAETDEPIFHAEWERRMFALMLATFANGSFKGDEFRHAINRMEPAEYLNTSYYEHWLHSLERLLVEKGQVAPGELEAAWENAANAADAEGAA
jgi:nitrile hydratase